MANQLRSEFHKLLRFGVFYVSLGLILLMCGYCFAENQVRHIFTDIYTVFHDGIQDNSFTFFIALITAWFIGNDFSNRTVNREIVSGCGRWSVIISRTIPVWIMNTFFHFFWVAAYMLFIGFGVGFDTAGFSSGDIAWCGTVLLQIIALSSVLTFISFVCEKTYSAITACVITVFFGCNIMRNFITSEIYRCSCFCFASQTDGTFIAKCSVSAVITIAVMMTATYLIFRNTDLS